MIGKNIQFGNGADIVFFQPGHMFFQARMPGCDTQLKGDGVFRRPQQFALGAFNVQYDCIDRCQGGVMDDFIKCSLGYFMGRNV
jgi:hypothetical protein